jgi:hypothetical protein
VPASEVVSSCPHNTNNINKTTRLLIIIMLHSKLLQPHLVAELGHLLLQLVILALHI